MTDGYGFALLQLARSGPNTGHSRGFGGAVEVEEFCVWERFAPHGVLAGWKDLTAKRDGGEILGWVLFEKSHTRDHGQRRDDPADGIDLIFVEKVAERHGKRKILFGNKVCRSTEFDDGHELLEGSIKKEGRLVGKDAFLREAELLGKVFDIINDRAVASNHSLGDAGRARCENDVDGISINLFYADCLQGGIVDFVFEQGFARENFAIEM